MAKKWQKLTKIFFIGILDFKVDMFSDDRYLHHGQILDIKSKKVMNDKLNFIYVELVKFKKERAELANHLEKWLYLLSNLSDLEDMPLEFKEDKEIEEAFKIANYANLSEIDRDEYERNLKIYRDLINSLDTAKNDGANEKAVEIAKNLLDVLDTETISIKTGLTIEEVEKLKV